MLKQTTKLQLDAVCVVHFGRYALFHGDEPGIALMMSMIDENDPL